MGAVYSRRGRKALQRHGDHIVKSAIRMLDKLLAAADGDDATIADVRAAYSAVIEMLPYIRPKMMSVAPGVLDSDGAIVSPAEYQRLLEIAREAGSSVEGFAQRALCAPPTIESPSEERTLCQGTEEGLP